MDIRIYVYTSFAFTLLSKIGHCCLFIMRNFTRIRREWCLSCRANCLNTLTLKHPNVVFVFISWVGKHNQFVTADNILCSIRHIHDGQQDNIRSIDALSHPLYLRSPENVTLYYTMHYRTQHLLHGHRKSDLYNLWPGAGHWGRALCGSVALRRLEIYSLSVHLYSADDLCHSINQRIAFCS